MIMLNMIMHKDDVPITVHVIKCVLRRMQFKCDFSGVHINTTTHVESTGIMTRMAPILTAMPIVLAIVWWYIRDEEDEDEYEHNC